MKASSKREVTTSYKNYLTQFHVVFKWKIPPFLLFSLIYVSSFFTNIVNNLDCAPF
jgi:hypothetical protein